MKKTTVTAAVLAGLLTFGGAGAAIAANVLPYRPSVTLAALYNLNPYGTFDKDGDYVKGDDYLVLNTNEKDETVAASAEIANDIVGNGGLQDVVDEATLAGIWNALDEEVTDIETSEVIPFVPSDPTSGAVNIKLQFPSNYKIGEFVAVVIGAQQADGTMEWFVVQGQVTDDGVVQAHLSAQVLAAINGPAVCGIVNSVNGYAE